MLSETRGVLTQALLRAAREVMAEKEIDLAVVHASDREGPSGDAWPNLKELFEESAERALPRLLAQPGPLLLTHPGLVGRYRLHRFLGQLLQATEQDQTPAVLLLVPSL